MHPDLDLSGVLKEAYRGEMESEAEKKRLLLAATGGWSGAALAVRVAWIPVVIAILVLLGGVS